MRNVLVLLPVDDGQKEYLIRQGLTDGHDTEFTWTSYDSVTPAMAKEADVIIGNIDPEILRKVNAEGHLNHLKWLQLNSAGADPYTQSTVLPEHVILTNSAGAYGTSVSEHMLAMTFSLIRRFDQYGRQQARHEWKTAGKVTSVEGSTVLVLGLGDIGGRYARMMSALGAYVIGVRHSAHSDKATYLDEQHTIDELDDLLPRADIVAMVLPGNAETEHIMDERRLRLMKKGAYLINDGRGNAIDPQALKKVLREGQLGGVGLDVTEPEPLPQNDELWDMDRVIITPHIAGQFLLQKTFDNVVKIAGENLHAYFHGEELKHIVDRSKGY